MRRPVSLAIQRRFQNIICIMALMGTIKYFLFTQISRWWTYRVPELSYDDPSFDTCHWKHVQPKNSDVGFEMCLRENDLLSNIIRRYGSLEDCDVLLDVWKKRVYDGLFVDAGANIGTCSLLLAANGANVVAFEPQPSNLFYFEESIRRSSARMKELIDVRRVGLGNQTGIHTIFAQRGNEGNSVIDIPIAGQDKDSANMKKRSFTIKVETLDDMLWPEGAVMPTVALLKIDVQGYEHNVLMGARRLIDRGAIKVIRFELSSRYLSKQGSSALDVCLFLERYEFKLFNDKGTRIAPMDCPQIGKQTSDIIAIL